MNSSRNSTSRCAKSANGAAYRGLVADFGGPEGPRIDPWTLNVDRTLRRSPVMCVVEERDEAGRWTERGRFGSYDEAAEALDRLTAGSEQPFRIRRLGHPRPPRRWWQFWRLPSDPPSRGKLS